MSRGRFIAVVATDNSWGIGKGGRLLAHVRRDMQYFRELTAGLPVIYGRKTLATFPLGRPLPGRRNIVMSRSGITVEGAEVVHSERELMRAVRGNAAVIGGGEIYALLLRHCSKVYVTRFHRDFNSDTFFPNLDDSEEWSLTGVMDTFTATENDSVPGMKCSLLVYERQENE
ncbi:MAG: dihydrofolate reductase [Clostridia bacterium]|nr:dihydrofolate reductase [Clostridia bacterium]